jgi:hypothetical protein
VSACRVNACRPLLRRLGLVEIKGNTVVPRAGYTSVSSLLGEYHPTSTDMSAYQPVITPPPACSSVHTMVLSAPPPASSQINTIYLSPEIPPSPDEHLCKCMMDSLQCVAKQEDFGKQSNGTRFRLNHTISTIADDAERGMMQNLCPQNETWCVGSLTDPTTGHYGSLSVCNASHRASWVLNQASSSSTNATGRCSANGGVFRRPVSSNTQPEGCKLYMQQIGPDGTGKITKRQRFYDLDHKGPPTESSALGTPLIIAIAVSLITLAVMGTAGLIWWRRRRRIRPEKSSSPTSLSATGDEVGFYGKSELPDNRKHFTEVEGTARRELDGEERKEMDGEKVFEGDTSYEIFEMATVHNRPAEMEAPLGHGDVASRAR